MANRGKNVGYIECDVTDQDAKLVAKATSTCVVLRGEYREERVNRWMEWWAGCSAFVPREACSARVGGRRVVLVSTDVSRPDLAAFVARYLAAWNDQDPGAMAELLAEDIVWEDPALPVPARGVAAVQQFMRAGWAAFPDLRFDEPEPAQLIAGGGLVAWRWRMRGTMTGTLQPPGFAPTGRSMEVEGVDMWTMRDGRIARYRAFYDMNEVARQLAIAPASGSRGEQAIVALQRVQARVLRWRQR